MKVTPALRSTGWGSARQVGRGGLQVRESGAGFDCGQVEHGVREPRSQHHAEQLVYYKKNSCL